MEKLVKLIGRLLGNVDHFLFGCKRHYQHKQNNKGKFYKRHCNWCGRRQDRVNGKWKTIGFYNLKGEKE